MIICDTNIWYDLTKNIVEKYSLQNKLICTHTTLVELISSHNLYNRPEDVKRAIRNIREFGILFPPNPFEHALSKFIPSAHSNGKNSSILWNGLIKFLNSDFDLDQERKGDVRKILNDKSKGFLESIDFINEQAAQIKMYNKNNKIKAKEYKRSLKIFFADMLIHGFQKQIGYSTSFGISLNHPNWESLELFVNVWSAFYKDLEFHPDQKMKQNDWGDLVNMIYVGQDDQYWTMENKWIRYIKGGKNTGRYIYELDLNVV